MPSTREIRRRIRSVKNTSQITKAMQMVAASKMRRAQQTALGGRPYTELMNRVMAEVSHGSGEFSHPLMEQRERRKTAVILISSDKGLCGALNGNLMREAANKYDKNSTQFITAGRKAAQYVGRTKRHLAGEFSFKDNPEFQEARAISKFARDLFLKGEVDAVEILYTNFISTLQQSPTIKPFLPVGEVQALNANLEDDTDKDDLAKSELEFLFEPTPAQVFGALLPHYLNYLIYQVLLEAKASEHSARMVAMKNATDNANKLIKDLTLEYNKIRQANITNELLEITTAQMAVG